MPLPYFPEVGVLGLVPDFWGGAWQARHQILTRLARFFHVVWVNPAREWRDIWLQQPSMPRSVPPDDAITPGLVIYEPGKLLPLMYWPAFLARFTAKQRLRRAAKILRQKGCQKTILYLWRPEYEPALDLIGYDRACYHMDDEYTFSETEKPMEDAEARIISRVQQVFIHSPALYAKKGHLNPQTTFVPNGVNYRAYSAPSSEPDDMRIIPRPRIGYVGIIKQQLDLPLLVTLAERHREWSFVFIGPQGYLGDSAPLVEQLSRMLNVHFLSRKPVALLPAYTQHLDVCIMCYAINDYTKFIYPLKLHEYLASGRPVVASPIRSVQDFAHVVTLARTADEWSKALTDSLTPDACAAMQVEARRAVAREHDWDRLARLIAQTFCARLGPSYSERFERISL